VQWQCGKEGFFRMNVLRENELKCGCKEAGTRTEQNRAAIRTLGKGARNVRLMRVAMQIASYALACETGATETGRCSIRGVWR
jgi:hypothetical protein